MSNHWWSILCMDGLPVCPCWGHLLLVVIRSAAVGGLCRKTFLLRTVRGNVRIEVTRSVPENRAKLYQHLWSETSRGNPPPSQPQPSTWVTSRSPPMGGITQPPDWSFKEGPRFKLLFFAKSPRRAIAALCAFFFFLRRILLVWLQSFVQFYCAEHAGSL